MGSAKARSIMAGIRLETRRDGSRAVATNGSRLSVCGFEVIDYKTGDPVTIPSAAIAELITLLDCEADDVEMLQLDKRTFFRSGPDVLTSRQIEGQFPDYKRVIPEKNGVCITADSRELADMMRRVSLVLTMEDIGVTLSFSQGSLSVGTESQQHGKADDMMPVDYDGDDIVLSLDCSFVSDFVSAAHSESISIYIKDRTSPVLFEAGADYQYICSPITLD